MIIEEMKSAFRYRLNDTLLSFLPKFLSSLQEIFDFRVFKMQNLKKKMKPHFWVLRLILSSNKKVV